MATTLVGIFDSLTDAGRARDTLLREGLEASSVHLTDNKSMSTTTTTEDHRGFFARLFGLGDDDATTADSYSRALQDGAAMLTVTLPDGADTGRIESLLESAGATDVDERGMRGGTTATDTTGRGDTLKVVQEELQVGKRTVENGGVRVRQFVTERPVQEQVQLCEERAIVERRPVDRVLSEDEAGSLDLRDREIELRERSEVPVVQKQARVVEEVRVGKEANLRTETVEDTVRRTDVDVEQLTAAQQAQRQGGTLRTQPPR
jgi:stress response protein YsnF